VQAFAWVFILFIFYLLQNLYLHVRVLFADEVTVVVDGLSVMHILGSTMDFVEDRLRAEFVFTNPNAKGTCGCGESFSV
jgi:iron-sulfur cluster assembly accessory protein